MLHKNKIHPKNKIKSICRLILNLQHIEYANEKKFKICKTSGMVVPQANSVWFGPV